MRNVTMRREDAPDLRFDGELLAEADGRHEPGPVGQWCELRLYRTAAGKLVAERTRRTQWDGEHDTTEASVFTTEAEAVEFFGYGRLAKRLYDEAGIEHETEVV